MNERLKQEKALRELAECVRRYRAHNDQFERALNERHTRWADRGLLEQRRGRRP